MSVEPTLPSSTCTSFTVSTHGPLSSPPSPPAPPVARPPPPEPPQPTAPSSAAQTTTLSQDEKVMQVHPREGRGAGRRRSQLARMLASRGRPQYRSLGLVGTGATRGVG